MANDYLSWVQLEALEVQQLGEKKAWAHIVDNSLKRDQQDHPNPQAGRC